MKKRVIFSFVCFLFFSFSFHIAKAQTNTSYTVSIVKPSNQKDGIGTYYELSMKPKQTDILYLNITSTKSLKQTITIIPANALTGVEGGIVYMHPNHLKDAYIISDSFKLSQYINVISKIELNPYQKKRIPITVIAPNANSGTFLGGIIISSNLDEQNNNKKQNVTIETKIQRSIAIQMDMPKKGKPNIKFDGIKAKNTPYGIKLFLGIENNGNDILREKTISYEVKNINDNSIFNGNLQDFHMAPMTYVEYMMDWNGEMIKPGNYIIKIKANGKTQTFPFKVTTQQVIEHQKETKTSTPSVAIIPFYWYIIFLGLIILIAIIFFLLGRRTKERKG